MRVPNPSPPTPECIGRCRVAGSGGRASAGSEDKRTHEACGTMRTLRTSAKECGRSARGRSNSQRRSTAGFAAKRRARMAEEHGRNAARPLSRRNQSEPKEVRAVVASVLRLAASGVCVCRELPSPSLPDGWACVLASSFGRTVAGAGLHRTSDAGSENPRCQVCSHASRARRGRIESRQVAISIEGRSADRRESAEKSQRPRLAAGESARRSARWQLRFRHQVAATRPGSTARCSASAD